MPRLTLLLPVVLLAGCASKPDTVPPTDDRLASVNDLYQAEQKHVDAASTSNGDTLANIRKARELLHR